MLQDCINRLSTLGYTYVELNDKALLEFLILKETNYFIVECNISTIPTTLEEQLIDLIVGEFLLEKKGSGQLDMANIDLDMIQKSIQMGDTKVEYAVENGQSPETRFDTLVKQLVNVKKSMLVSFRCLRW